MKKIFKYLFTDWILGLALMSLVFAGFLYDLYPLEMIENSLLDGAVKFRQKEETAPVVIVAIDEESIDRAGPWPRSRVADMIGQISSAKAKVIGLDLLYSRKVQDEGISEIDSVIKNIRENPKLRKNKSVAQVIRYLKAAQKNLDGDARLSYAIRKSRNVLIPLSFTLNESPGDYGIVERLKEGFLNSLPLEPPSAGAVVVPVAGFSAAAKAVGHTVLGEGRDGVVRSVPLYVSYKGKYYPSFALQLAMGYMKGYLPVIKDIRGISSDNGIEVSGVNIPTDSGLRLMVNYNRDRFYEYYSAAEVLEGNIPADAFRDKIVIISRGNLDDVSSPALIMANVIENVLNGNFLARPNWAFPLEAGVILYFGLFIAFVIPRVRGGIGLTISLIFLLTWLTAAAYIFFVYGFWLKVLTPAIVIVAGYPLIMYKRYILPIRGQVEAENMETNKMLGLALQGQGMLDMAFDKFRKCPAGDNSVKELLYNLGLDFERKRMANKAVAVYEHILKAGKFKDLKKRIESLKSADEKVVLQGGSVEKTMILGGGSTNPTFGRYEIIKELGQGAMGTVYLGKDPKINREVAIKTLRCSDVEEDQVEEVRKRFFREAEAAGKLSHPNIVTIFDVGEEHDISYMAMELLDGPDLSIFCSREKLMPLPEVLHIVSSVASALDYAHANGVVHRDIKPANIMLLKSGKVKVADFGIARVMASSKTQTGMILGTPSYMSPEQITGKKVDGRSDIFSLGAVFYELLTGERPFAGDSFATLMYNITNATYVSPKELVPHIPDSVVSIIEKMLTRGVGKRYKSGSKLADDITECMKSLESK